MLFPFEKCGIYLLITSSLFSLVSSFLFQMHLSPFKNFARTRLARPMSLHVCRKFGGINTQTNHLNKLRDKMSEMNINAVIVPSDDPHLSEYVQQTLSLLTRVIFFLICFHFDYLLPI